MQSCRIFAAASVGTWVAVPASRRSGCDSRPLRAAAAARTVVQTIAPDRRVVQIGTPEPFSTDAFKGRALLLMGGNGFELRVQGAFSDVEALPSLADIWFGAELLGPLDSRWSWVYRIVLACVARLSPGGMHVCMNGDGVSTSTVPGIVFPLAGALDSVVVTPRATFASAPTLALASNSLAPKAASLPTLEPGDIITICYSNSFVDVVNWRVRVPGIGNLDLHRFWGQAPLRLCAYVLGRGTLGAADSSTHHLSDDKRYLFAIDVSHETE